MRCSVFQVAMKSTYSLLSLLAALVMPVALQAQSPDQPHRGGPPAQAGSDHKHDHHSRSHPHGRSHTDGQGDGDKMDRAAHIREAMNHLRAAGLGMMAGHMEEMAKKFGAQSHGSSSASAEKQDGHSQKPSVGTPMPFGHHGFGHGFTPSKPWGTPSARPQMPSFGAPMPFGKSPFGHGSIGAKPPTPGIPQQQGGGVDELRQEVRRLAGQVQELSAMMKGQRGGSPQYHRPDEPKRGPQPQMQGRPPGAEQRREQPSADRKSDEPRRPEIPQGGKRPESDQPRREGTPTAPAERPAGDQPKAEKRPA